MKKIILFLLLLSFTFNTKKVSAKGTFIKSPVLTMISGVALGLGTVASAISGYKLYKYKKELKAIEEGCDKEKLQKKIKWAKRFLGGGLVVAGVSGVALLTSVMARLASKEEGADGENEDEPQDVKLIIYQGEDGVIVDSETGKKVKTPIQAVFYREEVENENGNWISVELEDSEGGGRILKDNNGKKIFKKTPIYVSLNPAKYKIIRLDKVDESSEKYNKNQYVVEVHPSLDQKWCGLCGYHSLFNIIEEDNLDRKKFEEYAQVWARVVGWRKIAEEYNNKLGKSSFNNDWMYGNKKLFKQKPLSQIINKWREDKGIDFEIDINYGELSKKISNGVSDLDMKLASSLYHNNKDGDFFVEIGQWAALEHVKEQFKNGKPIHFLKGSGGWKKLKKVEAEDFEWKPGWSRHMIGIKTEWMGKPGESPVLLKVYNSYGCTSEKVDYRFNKEVHDILLKLTDEER